MNPIFTLDSPRQQLALLSEGGPTSPDTMMAEFRAGTRSRVRATATVYVHGPNRNHVLLDEAELEQFAASFVGQPFLADHERSQSARGGTITASELAEIGGKKVIVQTLTATKPWAIEGMLDGTVDRFSIGWNSNSIECTACGTDFFADGHAHTPYDLGKKDKKTGKVIEALMKGLEGMETSAVTHPAVPGTGVREVLQQFAQVASGISPGKNKEDGMLAKVLELMGLAPDTPEPEALAQIDQRLKAERVPATLLTALGLGGEATTDQAVARAYTLVPREELAKLEAKLGEDRADALVRKAKDEGRITPAMEAWAREFALRNPDEAEKCFAELPVQAPVPNTPVPVTGDPGKAEEVNEQEAEEARQCGLSVEAYREGRKQHFAVLKGGK